jgi:hypothetical protein
MLVRRLPEALATLGCPDPSYDTVRGWMRQARAESTADMQTRDPAQDKALAIARLDQTVEPLILAIEAARDEGRAATREIEALRRIVATQAEIQGLTRQQETLADALADAITTLQERQRRTGTITTERPSPILHRQDHGATMPQPTIADRETVKRRAMDHRPAAIAVQRIMEAPPSEAGDVAVRTEPYLQRSKTKRDRDLSGD